MEARIIKWQSLAEDRKATMDELDAIRQATLLEEQNKQRIERMEKFIDSVPMRFRRLSFNDYQTDTNHSQQINVKQIALRYAETFADRCQKGTSITMVGQPGTGKTFLSLLIYQAIVKQGYTACYEASLDVISHLLNLRFSEIAKFDTKFRQLSEVDFLVMDEVTESLSSHGMPSEPEKNLLLRLINARYENKKCTCVITNRPKMELANRLGQPTVDRLSEDGLSLFFNWPSYRTK